MNGYIEIALGPACDGLDGAVRLFRRVWPVVASHGDSVEVLVRHGGHRGWGSVGPLLRLDQPWTRLGPLVGLNKDVLSRIQDLTELTLEVFFLVPVGVARGVVAALPGTERQRRDDLADLPLSEPEGVVLGEMLRLCADGRSALVGAADEGNLVYMFGNVSALRNIEREGA